MNLSIPNNRPILSVCIPTFNRPKEFERALKNVLPQLDDSMEIVVRDDSTDDASFKVFEELTKDKRYAVQYYKGEKIGLDAANLFLLEKALGNYIWWLSDDDILIEGGIRAAVNVILSDQGINFIWANFAYQDMFNLVVDKPSGYFSSGSEVVRSLGVNIGLLSTYIIKTDVGRHGLDYAKKHVHGFSFASTAIVFWILAHPGRFYFLRGPFILCNPTSIDEIKKATIRNDGSIENAGFITYGVYFYEMVMGLSTHFDPSAVRKLLTLNFGALWRGMLVAWVGGWDTPHGKRIKMLKIYWSFPECWIAIPLFCLPRSVIKIFYKTYGIFFEKRKYIFNERLKQWLKK